MPRGTFTNLGVNIAGQTRDITGFNTGNNQYTVSGALGAAPAVGTPFTVFATGISGVGQSTFRTDQNSIFAGGNVFTNIISDFSTAISVGGSDPNPLFGNPQTFTWRNLANPFYP